MISVNFKKSSIRKANLIEHKVKNGTLGLGEIQWFTSHEQNRDFTKIWEKCEDPLKGFDEMYITLPDGFSTDEHMEEHILSSCWYDMAKVIFHGVELWLFAPDLMKKLLPLFQANADAYRDRILPPSLGEEIEMRYHAL
jgi:hypothetical protein